MKNLESRIELLEATAKRWKIDNKVYEFFEQENNKARAVTWSQKVGRIAGDWIEFETSRAALDWVIVQLGRGGAQVFLDDIRSIMDAEERLIFDALFPEAPDYKVMFDLRKGQDVIPEAVRLWRHCLSGTKYNAWWEKTNAHINNLLSR